MPIQYSRNNPAEEASYTAFQEVCECIDDNKCFELRAGAGAGKTFTLGNALKYIIEKRGKKLLRRNQRVACITYTNVAKDKISSRIDNHPAVITETIHSFCWMLIKDFQVKLRPLIPE
jgi:DNA helicase-2/ATP-dependent DNA helicase PcrA